MKIRVFRTKERSTATVWEVTPKGLQHLDTIGTLNDAVASLGNHIVSFSVAATVELGDAYLYHSFLLRD